MDFDQVNLRKSWFAYVATTRRKLKRKLKKDVSHREAMKEASVTWPKEKAKILNRIKRQKKRAKKTENVSAESKIDQ